MTGAGLRSWLEDRRSNSRREGGVVAVIVAFLAVVLLSIAAFTGDVGSWYVEGHREQRAADAAAVAGVVLHPGKPAKATATARTYAAAHRVLRPWHQLRLRMRCADGADDVGRGPIYRCAETY